MISLLFSTSFWYDVLIAAAIVLIIIACIRYKNAKYFVGTILAIALITSTCYCAIQLNYYYTAEGGIYGKLSGIFNTNTVEVEDLKFEFKNIELVKENGDLYSAKMFSDKVLKLSNEYSFMVYVNENPCSLSKLEIEEDYAIATYSYAFFDENKNLLCEDTLTFHFAFYSNSTYLSISTNGGAESVRYWNNYFNKNLFIVEIKKIDFVYDKEFLIGTGDTSNYAIVNYTDTSAVSIVPKGEYITLPEDPLNYGINKNFKGWSVNGSEPLASNSRFAVQEDLVIEAVFANVYSYTYMLDGEPFEGG